MANGTSQNYNVKQITLTQLIPAFVNKTLLTPSVSDMYLDLYSVAFNTQWKTAEEGLKNQSVVLAQLLKLAQLVVLSAADLESFCAFMRALDHGAKKEQVKVETLRVVAAFLRAFVDQVLGQQGVNEKLQTIQRVGFMPALTAEILKYLTDYFESVRELAQELLLFVVQEFMPVEI